MDPFNPILAAVATASIGDRACEALLFYLDSWRGKFPHVGRDLYGSAADLSNVLTFFVDSLDGGMNFDEEKIQCVCNCLSDCQSSVMELASLLKTLRKHSSIPRRLGKGSVPFVTSPSPLSRIEADLRSIVADIRECLEPALDAMKLTQTDTNTAVTSGFEKGQSSRYRSFAKSDTSYTPNPAADPVKTIPAAEEGEYANGKGDIGPDSILAGQEHFRPNLHPSEVTGATGKQLTLNSSAPKRTALLRRIPFRYLLSALAFIFISSSSAVGLYFSISQNAMGDGFTTAGFILAVGTLTVTPPAAYHY